MKKLISCLVLVACSLVAQADQGKIDPSTWRPDGVREVWRDFGGGLALRELEPRCNHFWDGVGVTPCDVNYWTHFDRHPEWYPEVFIPYGVLPKMYPDDCTSQVLVPAQAVPEPEVCLMLGLGLGLGLIPLWRRHAQAR